MQFHTFIALDVFSLTREEEHFKLYSLEECAKLVWGHSGRGVPEHKYIIWQSTNSGIFMNICFIQIFLFNYLFLGRKIHVLHDTHFLIWTSFLELGVLEIKLSY